MTKMPSALGGFAPLTRGFDPGPRCGLCPQTKKSYYRAHTQATDCITLPLKAVDIHRVK